MNPPPKPALRGVFHQYAFFGFLVANILLYTAVVGATAEAAVAIYAASLAFLFGVSAIYHRVHWSPVARRRMRALDHSGIFITIAGGYTPMLVLLLPDEYPGYPLALLWSLAGLGIAKSVLWTKGPKWVTPVLAAATGWALAIDVYRLAPTMGSVATFLLVASGVVHSIGAVIYARKRPNPYPLIFGYHEIFHLVVVLATMLHFFHILGVLRVVGAL